MDKRFKNNRIEYLLKWDNFDDSFNSWEPKKNLDCKELIIQFESQIKRERKELEKNNKRPVSARKSNISTSMVKVGKHSDAGPSNKRGKRPQSISKAFVVQARRNGEDNIIHKKSGEGSNKVSNEGYEGKTPEKIIGVTTLRGRLMFYIKWEGVNDGDLIAAEKAYEICPKLAIKFYEDRVVWIS